MHRMARCVRLGSCKSFTLMVRNFPFRHVHFSLTCLIFRIKYLDLRIEMFTYHGFWIQYSISCLAVFSFLGVSNLNMVIILCLAWFMFWMIRILDDIVLSLFHVLCCSFFFLFCFANRVLDYCYITLPRLVALQHCFPGFVLTLNYVDVAGHCL